MILYRRTKKRGTKKRLANRRPNQIANLRVYKGLKALIHSHFSTLKKEKKRMRKFNVNQIKSGELMAIVNALQSNGFELYQGQGLKPILCGPTELSDVYGHYSNAKFKAWLDNQRMYESLQDVNDPETGVIACEALTSDLIITSHNCMKFSLGGSLKGDSFLINLQITADHNRAFIEQC